MKQAFDVFLYRPSAGASAGASAAGASAGGASVGGASVVGASAGAEISQNIIDLLLV